MRIFFAILVCFCAQVYADPLTPEQAKILDQTLATVSPPQKISTPVVSAPIQQAPSLVQKTLAPVQVAVPASAPVQKTLSPVQALPVSTPVTVQRAPMILKTQPAIVKHTTAIKSTHKNMTPPKQVAMKNHPMLVLVHGDMFTSASWEAVQNDLQLSGYDVVTVDLPGRAEDHVDPKKVTIKMAVEKLCAVVNLQPGPVIIVGHGQNGAIITAAVGQCPAKIKALVYVAAVAPLNGQMTLGALSQQDHANLDSCSSYDSKHFIIVPMTQGPLIAMEMADVPFADADNYINQMVSEPAGIAGETLQYPEAVFNAIPKYYIETLNDKLISIATQKQIEHSIHPNQVYTIDSAHSPFYSKPVVLANDLKQITDQFSTN